MRASHSILTTLFAAFLTCGCAPHVRQISPTVLEQLKQNSSPRNPSEFPNGQLRLEYPIKLRPGTVLELPLKPTHQIPTIPGDLDGSPVPWILDTGANFPILTDAETASLLKLQTIHGAVVKGVGVGGNTNLLLGRFHSLELDGQSVLGSGTLGILLQTYHFKFAGFPLQRMPLNLLGLPFLELFSYVTLDSPAQQVELGYKRTFHPPANAVSFPFQTEGGRIWVKIQIAGQTVRAFLDTGYGSSLRLPPDVLHKLPASAWASQRREKRRAMGVGGVEVEELGTLTEAFLGPIRIAPVQYDTNPACTEAMLGWGPFHSNRMTLDFQRKRVWIER